MKLRLLIVLIAGVALGVASQAIARRNPSAALGGGSMAAAFVLLGVGWALIACGVVAWARRPSSHFGRLLAAAGFAWFVVEFNNPGVGSPVVFTIGLLTSAACPAFVAHAALAYPGGRLAGRRDRALVALAYADLLIVLGLLPALVFDPAAQACSQCPPNLAGVTSAPGLVALLDHVGVGLALATGVALAVLAIARIARFTSAARRLLAPVLAPAAAYLALVAADYAYSLGRGFLSNDAVDERLWLAQSAALAALVLGVVLAWVREWQARTAVARLVVELGEAPAPGGLRDALARALADPELELAYPLDEHRHVNAHGRSVELPRTAGRAITPLLRGGKPVALLLHRSELLDDAALLEQVGRAATLALEHERLQAEARAQLDELRASRVRTVQAGDAERRRLERDLHDGAQQRLVVLSLALRLLRAELGGAAAGRLDAAEAELSAALAELRDLARGIYPAVLTDEGLDAALSALAEAGRPPIVVHSVPDARLAPAVEAAAYFLVAEIAKRNNTATVTVRTDRSDRSLVVEIDTATLDGDLIDLEDRIGALDGELTLERTPAGRATIRAKLPCAS